MINQALRMEEHHDGKCAVAKPNYPYVAFMKLLLPRAVKVLFRPWVGC